MSTIYTTTDDYDINSAALGTAGAAPASGTVAVRAKRLGNFWSLNFTFTAARITVTDAAGSGSSGSLLLWTFPEQVVAFLGSRHNWTAFAEGSALTTAAGDAAFIIAFGSVAADAGDGALTSTEVDIGAATATLTNSGGTTTSATKITGTLATPLDGTATAVKIYLNWSGSAATIDANSTFDLTGSFTVVGAFLGDD